MITDGSKGNLCHHHHCHYQNNMNKPITWEGAYYFAKTVLKS